MGEYQIWIIVVVVVLSIIDATLKKARKRAAGLPEGDEPLGTPGEERGLPPPGPVGAPPERVPEPVATRLPRESAPPDSRSRVPLPSPRPQSSRASQSPAGKRQSAFDILVPPEMRKELEEILSGGGRQAGQGAPFPTASGPSGPTSAPSPRDAPSVPAPSSAQELGDSGWGAAPLPQRSRDPRPVEVRSRAPRSSEARPDEPRRPSERHPAPARIDADAAPSAGRRPLDPSRLGFGTIDDLRRVVVAREVLGPPVAMRDENEFGAVR